MYRHVIDHGYAEGRKGYSRDDSENARLLICEAAHRIASDAMSDRDKIRAVHDWIVINTRYDVEIAAAAQSLMMTALTPL